MDKQESLIIKGVAISIMLFFHLFISTSVTQYDGTIWGLLARGNNPVPFFVFLSGYGLFSIYQRKGKDKNMLKRIFKLYKRYWLITTFFILISIICGKNHCDFSFLSVISNMTAWKTTFYSAAWFILPYTILTILMPILYKTLNNDKSPRIEKEWGALIISYLIWIAASLLGRYEWFRLNVFQCFYIQFSFVLGVFSAKWRIIEKCKNLLQSTAKTIPVILLLLLIAIRVYLYSGAFISFYVLAFIILFLSIKRPHKLDLVLIELGKHSLNIWLIHVWIFVYLLKDFIYSLKYPIFIWLVLLTLSYFCSLLLEIILCEIKKSQLFRPFQSN